MQIWFTSDLHLWLCHDRDFIFKPRGFENVESHNKEIVRKWNEVVSDEDIVYILGDIMLNDNEKGIELFNQLKGMKKIIIGNHDSSSRIALYSVCPNTTILGYADVVKYKGYHFYLSHYPTLTSNLDDDKPLKTRTICLCGHSHYKNKFKDMDKGLIFHCELDTNNCYPWSIDEIIKEIKTFISLDDNAKKELSESDI